MIWRLGRQLLNMRISRLCLTLSTWRWYTPRLRRQCREIRFWCHWLLKISIGPRLRDVSIIMRGKNYANIAATAMRRIEHLLSSHSINVKATAVAALKHQGMVSKRLPRHEAMLRRLRLLAAWAVYRLGFISAFAALLISRWRRSVMLIKRAPRRCSSWVKGEPGDNIIW